MLTEPVYGVSEIDRGLSGDDIGDPLLPEHGQVILWGLFTHHTDEVMPPRSPSATVACRAYRRRWHRILIGERQRRAEVLPARSSRDERLILCEVLLHRRATANPGIAVQLRSRCLVLALARDYVKSCAVDLPVHRREHVTNNIRSHYGPFRR